MSNSGKMAVNFIIIFVLICCFLFMENKISGAWDDPGTKQISVGIYGEVLCMNYFPGSEDLYIGTVSGLYKIRDLSDESTKVELPAGVSHIRYISYNFDRIFIAADSGVYMKGKDQIWERISVKKDIERMTVLSKDGQDLLFAWNTNELYRFNIRENTWMKIANGLDFRQIEAGTSSAGVIYLTSENKVYSSDDEGDAWKEVLVVGSRLNDNEIGEYEEEIDGEEAPRLITDMCPYLDKGSIVVSSRGLFMLNGEKEIVRIVDTSGLPANAVRYAASNGENIFVATNKRVFIYFEEKGWRIFYEQILPGDINALKIYTSDDGTKWLFIAAGQYIYRKGIYSWVEPGEINRYSLKGIDEFSVEPSIRDVQKMAIEYAEVSPEKIKNWRRGARWKAIFPKLSLGYSESDDDNVEIYKSATKAYVFTGPRELDKDWGIDVTWDLSDLIWNDAQTSIDVRSKLMVQLREDILEEVTRLFFERKRLIIDKNTAREEEKPLIEKELKIQELTAYIDALTGGKFSEKFAEGKLQSIRD